MTKSHSNLINGDWVGPPKQVQYAAESFTVVKTACTAAG